jgi:hypothetical protein
MFVFCLLASLVTALDHTEFKARLALRDQNQASNAYLDLRYGPIDVGAEDGSMASWELSRIRRVVNARKADRSTFRFAVWTERECDTYLLFCFPLARKTILTELSMRCTIFSTPKS